MFNLNRLNTSNVKIRKEKLMDKYIQNYKFNFMNNSSIQSVNSEKINILLRCTYRPTYFKKCIESILSQTYQHFNIIICYDDERCLEYLQKYNGHPKIIIYKAPVVDKNKSHFYNLYCNFLLEKVTDGWIMFLDDDDIYFHNNVFSMIHNHITSIDDFIIWKVKIGDVSVYPRDIYDIRYTQISGIGFCVHSKHKNKGRWIDKRGSDYIYISELLKNHVFNRKIIMEELSGTQLKIYGSNGLYDTIDFKEVINKYKLKLAHVSTSLNHFESRFFKNYSYNLN